MTANSGSSDGDCNLEDELTDGERHIIDCFSDAEQFSFPNLVESTPQKYPAGSVNVHSVERPAEVTTPLYGGATITQCDAYTCLPSRIELFYQNFPRMQGANSHLLEHVSLSAAI